jgi:hypothetical protein
VVLRTWAGGRHPAIMLGLLGAVLALLHFLTLYLISRRLLGAERGKRYTYVLRGGPRDGETRSITFCFPEGTLIEVKSRLRFWRRARDGSWVITAESTRLSDGSEARIAQYAAAAGR